MMDHIPPTEPLIEDTCPCELPGASKNEGDIYLMVSVEVMYGCHSHWSQFLGTCYMHVTYLHLYHVEVLPIGCVICKPIEYLLSAAAVPSGMEGGECGDAPVTAGCNSEPAPTHTGAENQS